MVEIGEKRRIEIREEAKQILNKFGKTLEKVKFKEKKSEKEIGGFREEQGGKKADEKFRKAMFENAINKNGDYLIAEKKKW